MLKKTLIPIVHIAPFLFWLWLILQLTFNHLHTLTYSRGASSFTAPILILFPLWIQEARNTKDQKANTTRRLYPKLEGPHSAARKATSTQNRHWGHISAPAVSTALTCCYCSRCGNAGPLPAATAWTQCPDSRSHEPKASGPLPAYPPARLSAEPSINHFIGPLLPLTPPSLFYVNQGHVSKMPHSEPCTSGRMVCGFSHRKLKSCLKVGEQCNNNSLTLQEYWQALYFFSNFSRVYGLMEQKCW